MSFVAFMLPFVRLNWYRLVVNYIANNPVIPSIHKVFHAYFGSTNHILSLTKSYVKIYCLKKDNYMSVLTHNLP